VSGQIYLTSPLAPGESSRPFELPAGNHHGHTYQREFSLTVFRDRGALRKDGTLDVDLPAPVTIRQNGVALARLDGRGGTVLFAPDPGAGECLVVNGGPGSVELVSITDPER
jgi:hypothetical protein